MYGWEGWGEGEPYGREVLDINLVSKVDVWLGGPYGREVLDIEPVSEHTRLSMDYLNMWKSLPTIEFWPNHISL